MKLYNFEDIRKNGWLLYEYVRGSQTYGTNTPTSDTDHGGVYLEPIEQLLGLGLDYQDEISNETHDDVWYSMKKYCRLLLSSNPNILESLFIDDKFVLFEHPIFTGLKKHRQEFVTKECFNSFIGYAIAQIKRAKGYNKLCNWEEVERKMPIDFCYTSFEQGSQNINTWLDKRGLKQRYCGLVSINNMPDCYGLYYDWGNHIVTEGITESDIFQAFLDNSSELYTFARTFVNSYYSIVEDEYELGTYVSTLFTEHKPIGYRGIVKEEGAGQSDDVRCSSVEKGVMPMCIMQYNKDGFTQHCKKYHQYQEWLQKRNQIRYESNLGHNYDSKNMMHCFRLINMGLEIAKTGEVRINRTGIDADFLLDIRNHKYEYDYLIKHLENKKLELDEAIIKSTLPDKIDTDKVNCLLLDIRKTYQISPSIKP